MAEFRTVQTRMWREDKWFQDLPVDARLLWVYLFTNPSASICGMYRLPVKTIAFESGLTCKRVEELLEQFEQAGKIVYQDSILWVVKMRDNQLGPKISENQQKGIDKDISKVPASEIKNKYLERYGYPIDTLSIGRATLRYVTVTDTVTGTCNEDVTSTCNAIEEKRIEENRKEEKIVAALPPAAQIYLDSGGKWPKGTLKGGESKKDKAIRLIVEKVGDNQQALKLWGEVVEGWCAQWLSSSYTSMLERFENGSVPGKRNNGHEQREPSIARAVYE